MLGRGGNNFYLRVGQTARASLIWSLTWEGFQLCLSSLRLLVPRSLWRSWVLLSHSPQPSKATKLATRRNPGPDFPATGLRRTAYLVGSVIDSKM
jgi:hypothetical protein